MVPPPPPRCMPRGPRSKLWCVCVGLLVWFCRAGAGQAQPWCCAWAKSPRVPLPKRRGKIRRFGLFFLAYFLACLFYPPPTHTPLLTRSSQMVSLLFLFPLSIFSFLSGGAFQTGGPAERGPLLQNQRSAAKRVAQTQEEVTDRRRRRRRRLGKIRPSTCGHFR